MSTERLGAYIMDFQYPYLKKTLATFLLSAKNITGADLHRPGARIMEELMVRLGDLIDRHLEQELHEFYPYLRTSTEKIEHAGQEGLALLYKKIRADHLVIERIFKKLRLMSNDYTPPDDASAVIKLSYAQLFNFEQDILKHIFIEEHVLFPKLLAKNALNPQK